MDELIERLEKAGGGSRELDIEIAAYIGWKFDQRDARGIALYIAPGDLHTQYLPFWTTSIDDKIPGENIISVKKIEYNLWRAVHEIDPPHHQLGGGRTTVGVAKTEPLARRIAALKAKQP